MVTRNETLRTPMPANPNAGNMNFYRSREEWAAEGARNAAANAALRQSEQARIDREWGGAKTPTPPGDGPFAMPRPVAQPPAVPPPQPRAPVVNAYAAGAAEMAKQNQFGDAASGVASPQNLRNTAPTPAAPAAPAAPTPRPSFADQMNGFQNQLDAQTASGPGPAPRPPSPEEILDKQIRAAGAGNAGTIAPEMLRDFQVRNAGQGNVGKVDLPIKLNTPAQNKQAATDTFNDVAGVKAPPGFEDLRVNQIQTGRDANGQFFMRGFGDPNGQANNQAALIKAAQSGDMTGLSGLQRSQADILRSGGTFDSYGNLQRKETTDFLAREAAAKQAEQSRPRGGGQTSAPNVDPRWAAFEKAKASGAFQKDPKEGLRQYDNRMRAMVQTLGFDMSDLGNLRTNAKDRANNQDTNATNRRGQDMDLQGKLLPKQMEAQMAQAQRQRMADTLRAATPMGADGKPTGEVNYAAAMQIAIENGDAGMAKTFAEYLDSQQKLVSGNNKVSGENMDRLSRFATQRDPENPAKLNEAANRDLINSVLAARPELASAPDPVLNAEMPGIMAQHSVLEKINRARREQQGAGFRGDILPSANPAPESDFTGQVPDSFWKNWNRTSSEGWLNWLGAEGGDTTLRNNAGWEGTYNLGKLNSDERAYIASRIKAVKEANEKK
jgi:hypothetical protein